MIISDKNTTIKDIIKLKDKKYREETGLFYIEGKRIITEIPDDSYIDKYVLSESFYNKYKSEYESIKNLVLVSDSVFKKISDTKTPQGIIAIVKKIHTKTIKDIQIKQNTFFLMLDKIADAGNLGTIIRSSEALGSSCIVLSKECVDIYNPKVIRSTMGAIFHIPIIIESDLKDDILYLKENGVEIICTHLDGEHTPDSIDFSKPTCVIIGSEAHGVLDEYKNLSDKLVKINMVGKVESMNASVSSAIILYERLRGLNYEK